MNILVTGATGFLGSYLLAELGKTHPVVGIGRSREKIQKLSHLAQMEYCDLTNDAQIKELMYRHSFDCVIHAAALSSAWGREEDFIAANVRSTALLVKLAISCHVKKFIFVSSPSIYSKKESCLHIKEEDVPWDNRLNYYIMSKIQAEKILQKYTKNIDIIILRPRGLIGAGDTSLVPRLLRANKKIGIPLFHKGQNMVDITCVENAAWACALAVNAPVKSGSVYNISNGEPCPFKQVLDLFLKEAGLTPHYREVPFIPVYLLSCLLEKGYQLLRLSPEPILTRYTVCTLAFSQTLDISKAKKELGYRPKVTLADGILKYGRWYRQQKENTPNRKKEHG